MPFLDRLTRWAEQCPGELAVACGPDRLTWSELRGRAAALAASGEPTGLLRQPSGTSFAVDWSAGVAEDRACAVLDPALPQAVLDQMRQRCREHLPAAPEPAQLRDGPAPSTFLLGLTSGTTAAPKGFRRSRESWQRSFAASARHFELRARDRVLIPGPWSASLNLYALSECLHAGAAAVGLESFDVAGAHRAIAEHSITRLVLVPAMLRVLADRGAAAGSGAEGITAIVCAGQKLDRATLEAARRWAPRAVIWEYFGASELGFVAARRIDPQDPVGAEGASADVVGAPFPGVMLQILDDDGAPVPEGEPGTVWVDSPLVCDDYLWGDDGRALRRRGALATVQDRGFLRGGQLHVLGRAAEMIVTGGHNVYPQEIEAVLEAVPGVAGAVVVGVPDETRGQRVVAAVLPSADGADRRRLREALAGRLAPAKRPQRYLELSALPLTEGGKISRRLLLDWIREGDAHVRDLG